MEVTGEQIERAKVRLRVYREIRDEIPEGTTSADDWHDRRRYDWMAQAVLDTLADLGIEAD